MKALVRMVCGGCLRSVELSAASSETLSNRCPHCGGPIESQLGHVDPASQDDETPPTVTHSLATEIGGPIDWVQTWARGSLGSLGRFQLRERLGDGGFGQVFRAYDPRLDRDVAIKVLKQPNPSEKVMERFFREARAVARLDHPYIVAVHDAGFDNNRCWVAYQLVSGRPLSWYRDHHQMDAMTVARITRNLADALDHSHRIGVVHRDIKPGNVLIDDQGRPRLIDFGLARRADFESDLTREGAILGTPAYMSPEQALGHSRQVDERSDVYSLGVIFHELLYGRRPDEPTVEAVAGRSNGSGKSASDANFPMAAPGDSNIPAVLKRICAKATATNPAMRHVSARALVEELEEWLDEQRRAGERRSARMPGATIGLVAAILVLIGLAGLFFSYKGRSEPVVDVPGPAGSAPLPLVSKPPLASSPRYGVELIGNREKHRYHRADCASVAAMSERNRILLESPEDARAHGLEPCEKCRPPVAENGRAATSGQPDSQ
jgi:serine/threonine protein kinase